MRMCSVFVVLFFFLILRYKYLSFTLFVLLYIRVFYGFYLSVYFYCVRFMCV